MLVLAVETSSPRGSLALAEISDSVRLLGESIWLRGKSHSELITSTVEQMLSSAGLTPDDLDGIAVGIGPGSFTGVRVGISFAKAFAYGLDLPVYPVESLKIWARPMWNCEWPILVAVHGFRDLIYTARFSQVKNGQRSIEQNALAQTFDQLVESFPNQPVALSGDTLEKFSDQWPEKIRRLIQQSSDEPPLAKFLFDDLVESSRGTLGTSWQNVKPLYIRGSEAEEKLRQGLLKPLPKL